MTLDVDALEASFDLVAPRGDELVDTFYTRLFAAAPAVQPLFAGTNLQEQKKMLLATLVLLRRCAARPRRDRAKLPGARPPARRVRSAQPEHYPVVGEVLIASMAEVAGDAWRAEYQRAWSARLGVVAGAMLEGAAVAR